MIMLPLSRLSQTQAGRIQSVEAAIVLRWQARRRALSMGGVAARALAARPPTLRLQEQLASVREAEGRPRRRRGD